MAWIILLVAGLLEIVWAFAMKKSDGFTVLMPSIVTIVTVLISFGMLAVAMKSLPLGTSYTIWTGIGAAGAFIAGAAFLGESLSPMRVLAAAMIIGGIILMRLASAE